MQILVKRYPITNIRIRLYDAHPNGLVESEYQSVLNRMWKVEQRWVKS